MEKPAKKVPKDISLKRLGLLTAIITFLIPWVVHFPGLSPEGHKVFSIFLLAIVLWVAEVIPLHATAALIIILEIHLDLRRRKWITRLIYQSTTLMSVGFYVMFHRLNYMKKP